MILCVCVSQPQQITVQGQQAQTAEGQTILYQPVNADGTVLQQGNATKPQVYALWVPFRKEVEITFG